MSRRWVAGWSQGGRRVVAGIVKSVTKAHLSQRHREQDKSTQVSLSQHVKINQNHRPTKTTSVQGTKSTENWHGCDFESDKDVFCNNLMKAYFAGPSGQKVEDGTSGVPHGGRTWVARVSHLVRNMRRTVVARGGFPQIVAIVSASWWSVI